MGEITSIIQKIHINKDEFKELVEKMDPLIKKYVRLLYKDNKEDVHSEMTLALWEAVIRMEYCESDGECLAFLCTALKNRFYELYLKSKKEHDNQQLIDNNDVFGISRVENIMDLENVIFNIDVEIFLQEYTGMKQKIFRTIILGNESDAEIAKIFSVSRQYINRLRRELYKEVLDRHFI